jgi:hypothetical protein
MQESKSIFLSKTFWGAVVVFAGLTAQALGYNFAAEDQQGAVNLITGIVEAIGGILAIYGRTAATKQIK